RIGIKSNPRLCDRIDIKRAKFMTKPHDRGRGHIDRQIYDKGLAAALREKRLQEGNEIIPPDRFLYKGNSPLIEKMTVLVLRVDDREARFVEFEMTFDERQHATPDRTKADQDNWTCDRAMHGPLRHWFSPEGRGIRAEFQRYKKKPPASSQGLLAVHEGYGR